MRRVCLAHNLLREPERQAFHGLVIAGCGLEEVARTLGLSGVEVARLARRGLEAVLIAAGQIPEARAGKSEANPAAAKSATAKQIESNGSEPAARAPHIDEAGP
jgi:hypothetical protein